MALALIGASIYLCFRVFRSESTISLRQLITNVRHRFSKSTLVRHLIIEEKEEGESFKNLLKHEGNLIKKGLKIVVQARFITKINLKNTVYKDTLQKVIGEHYDFHKTVKVALQLSKNEIKMTLKGDKSFVFEIKKVNGCFYDNNANIFAIAVENSKLDYDGIFLFFVKDNRIKSGYVIAHLVELILRLQSTNKNEISGEIFSKNKHWFIGCWADFYKRYSKNKFSKRKQQFKK